jgi:hypothetical protein
MNSFEFRKRTSSSPNFILMLWSSLLFLIHDHGIFISLNQWYWCQNSLHIFIFMALILESNKCYSSIAYEKYLHIYNELFIHRNLHKKPKPHTGLHARLMMMRAMGDHRTRMRPRQALAFTACSLWLRQCWYPWEAHEAPIAAWA